MLDNKVTKEGTLLLLNGRVYLDGWELEQPGMCREHAIFACLHTATKLQQAAMEIIAKGGGADYVASDMPNETPPAWLCEESRRFLASMQFNQKGDDK